MNDKNFSTSSAKTGVSRQYDAEVTLNWTTLMAEEESKPYFVALQNFLATERDQHDVFPAPRQVFSAFEKTPRHKVSVVILGQDPYHGAGQATGLAFSVQKDSLIPPSLRNILTELRSDMNEFGPANGDLSGWAQQGVLLLNTTLTVRTGEPGSHHGCGWETFTDSVISAVNHKPDPTVFVLWGAHARSKKALITNSSHLVIEAPHPSPLSAHRGFFGSKPFSRVNEFLKEHGREVIQWSE
jgi:uracil-DNA glycosylase